MIDEPSLEDALALTERDAQSAIRTATQLLAEAKKIQKLAKVGAVRDLARAMDNAYQLAGAARDAITTAKDGWRFDATSYMESGGYSRELLALAAERGVKAEEQDGRIVCYPSLLRVLPADQAVEIEKKRMRAIRPGWVIAQLQAASARPPKFKPERFLEALFEAYKLLGATRSKWQVGEMLRLVDIYKVLTVFPGTSSTYSRPEFARDIYLLDESRLDRTKEGLGVSLPASSGSTGATALRTVTRDGTVKTYYGILFTP